MALHIPYHRHTFRPVNDVLPGNATSDNPLEFDIVPAWGGDLARIKSIVFASLGLVNGDDWGPEAQEAVIAAFGSGAPAFLNTVTAIRGLSVPAIMAVRAGLIQTLPQAVKDGESVADPEAPYQVVNGLQFSRLCGAMPGMSLHVASEIAKISTEAERAMDPRFFKRPSGSGGPATAGKGRATNARTARPTSRRRATAASDSMPTGK